MFTCLLDTQLGTAVGLTVTTVVFNRVTAKSSGDQPTLRSYHAAQWTAFAFGVLGKSHVP